MIEDDIYRTSSQYRYWSFTRDTLAQLRQTSNTLASNRVRAAFKRVHAAKRAEAAASHAGNEPDQGREAGTDDDKNGPSEPEIDTLTVEEELQIVRWGCSKIIEMGEAMTPSIPLHIVVRSPPDLTRGYSAFVQFRCESALVSGISTAHSI